MEQRKEDLEKLIKFIEEISNLPENEWFKSKISQLGIKTSTPKNELTFESFVRFQKTIFKRKANEFYKNISDDVLKRELVKDFIEMSWYRMLNIIERYFQFAYYQVENMLNWYSAHNDCHTKIAANRSQFDIPLSQSFTVRCYPYFFDNNRPVDIGKVKSIWAKIAFWAIDNNTVDWVKRNKFSFDNLVTLRNFESHRNSMDGNNFALNQVNVLKISDDIKLNFTLNVLNKIKTSIN